MAPCTPLDIVKSNLDHKMIRGSKNNHKIPTVKTPPIIAQTFVIKCEKDFGFSVIKT